MYSYEYYRDIIRILKQSGKISDFYQVIDNQLNSFVVMRHDVEFSIERAYKLAELEFNEGFQSSYFFQLTNNTYNIASYKNQQLIKKIHDMGHIVGLHFHMNGLSDITLISEQIAVEIQIMSAILKFPIDIFSIHRPSASILKANLKIPGMINTYQDDFFSFTDDIEKFPPNIKYISDSRHQWNYSLEPNEETIKGYSKLQILIHPYSWTPKGLDNLHNFKTLISEKTSELKNSIDQECNHFGVIKHAL